MNAPTPTQTKSAAGIAWNLGASLFKAIDDPALTDAMAQAKTDVAAFEQKLSPAAALALARDV